MPKLGQAVRDARDRVSAASALALLLTCAIYLAAQVGAPLFVSFALR
jgi:hypothetical protein